MLSLLHLQHGEFLLESAACCTTSPPALIIPGRVWIATMSVYVEQRGGTAAGAGGGEATTTTTGKVLRIPFKHMPSPPTMSAMDSISFAHLKRLEMVAHRPYTTIMDGNNSMMVMVVVLKHTKPDKLVPLLHRLWELNHAKQNLTVEIERNVVLPRRMEPFDRSRLVDFRERVIIPTSSSSSSSNNEVLAVDRIESLVRMPGALVLTDKRVYFQPAKLNNLLGTRTCMVWDIADIVQCERRRFMMRPHAVELRFLTKEDKPVPSVLFAFQDGQAPRDEFCSSLTKMLPPTPVNGDMTFAEATLQWQNKQMDNFSYIQLLNDRASRSLLDLAQYPIFPWVLTDYESTELDLTKPQVFRDLSKPVGALDPIRLRQFRERFHSMQQASTTTTHNNEEENIPPFMYGTHYSTPGFVLFYLVRLKPDEMLHLQSGKFDSPDRMFCSVKEAFANVLKSPTDVKELIPEFYNVELGGEFLVNALHLDLGKRATTTDSITTTTTQKRLGDVELPPWAQSPADFVLKMRAALESEYVSQHLHEWIDLIFGYKQRGQAAVDADNVFYYMTYEGAIDLNKLDEMGREGVEAQIMEFGQTPIQLFAMPHPPRRAAVIQAEPPSVPLIPSTDKFTHSNGESITYTETITDMDLFPHLDWHLQGDVPQLLHSRFIDAHPRGAVTGVTVANDGTVYSCSKDGSLVFSSSQKGIYRRVGVSRLPLSCVMHGNGGLGRDGDVLVGSWDDCIYRYSTSTGRVTAKLDKAHEDRVSCLSRASSVSATGMASGGWDSAVKLWCHRNDGTMVEQCAFYGHECAIVGVCLSECGTMVVSAGMGDGKILLHDARRSYEPVGGYVGVIDDGNDMMEATCSLSWLSSSRKILMSSPWFGVIVTDVRKQTEPLQVVRANAAWRPQKHVTDGKRILVGDSSGRITAGLVEDVTGVSFDSAVLVRFNDCITALEVGKGGNEEYDMVIASGTRSGEVGVFGVK